jgi:hypothetical protein
MIHIRKEGQSVRIGLNITPQLIHKGISLTFIWVSYDVSERKLHMRRIRFRSYMRPFIFHEKREVDVVSTFMESNALIAVPRELLEDYAPKLIPLAGYFMQEFRAGVIGRYYG